MALGIGGSGVVGLGFETTYGTYAAPTKWIPVRSESLTDTEDKQILAPIKGVAVASHVKRGYKVIEGDLEFEVTSDLLPYILYCARMTPLKSGAGPYVYTFTPNSSVLPTTAAGTGNRKTASLYIERAGEQFAYIGSSVTSISFSIDAGDLIATAHWMGLELDTTVAPVAASYGTWAPFGPGDIAVSIPNNAARSDIDTFSIEINDNGEALNRIKAGERGPTYIKWGEREVGGSFDHDFQDMSEYDAFNNNDYRTMRVLASHGASDSVQIDLANIMSTSYPVNLSALGDLVRASVDYRAVYQGSNEYTIVCTTAENII
jgi:hypothetical protein